MSWTCSSDGYSRNVYRNVVEKPLVKQPPRRLRRIWCRRG